MDFFFDGASPYRAAFADMAGLGPIRTKEQPDICLPTAVDQTVRNYFQVLQEKRRRQHLANAPAKYKYLMELVSICVRHLKVLGPEAATPLQLDTSYPGSTRAGPMVAFALSKESDIYIPDAKFLKKFFVEAKRNRAMTSIARAHCHYAA